MSALSKPACTAQDYLEIERQALNKSEFVNGEIYAMAGGSAKHSLIAGNIIGELRQSLKRSPCLVHSSDLRVNVSAGDDYFYPDVTVVCGTPRFSDNYKDNLLNPTLIAEVLSDGTAAYDRGMKFEMYRRIESLQEYLLVAQNRCYIEHFHRQSDKTWLLTVVDDLAAGLLLPGLECGIAVAEIYDKVEFG